MLYTIVRTLQILLSLIVFGVHLLMCYVCSRYIKFSKCSLAHIIIQTGGIIMINIEERRAVMISLLNIKSSNVEQKCYVTTTSVTSKFYIHQY
jgi:hypothetical protein